MSNNPIAAVYFLPGQCHPLLASTCNKRYHNLAQAYERVRQDIESKGIERLVVYSTGWISVLGQMVQARAALKGVHVDENWHQLGSMSFHLRFDSEAAYGLKKHFESHAKQTRAVDYEGFPVDTGTIVTQQFLDPRSELRYLCLANHVYSDFSTTRALGGMVRDYLNAETTTLRTGICVISGLSMGWHSEEMDLREDDRIEPAHEQWNQRILAAFQAADEEALCSLQPGFATEARADMGFKAAAFLIGATSSLRHWQCRVEAYESIYGTGAAVLRFEPI